MKLVILLYYTRKANLTALSLPLRMLRISGYVTLFKTSGQKQQEKEPHQTYWGILNFYL